MPASLIRFPAAIALAALAVALGGCSQEPTPPGGQAATDASAPPEPAPTPAEAAPAPIAPAENAAAEREVAPPPAPPVSREAQMQDDAAASGMTARLPTGDDGGSDAGNAQQDRR